MVWSYSYLYCIFIYRRYYKMCISQPKSFSRDHYKVFQFELLWCSPLIQGQPAFNERSFLFSQKSIWTQVKLHANGLILKKSLPRNSYSPPTAFHLGHPTNPNISLHRCRSDAVISIYWSILPTRDRQMSPCFIPRFICLGAELFRQWEDQLSFTVG